MTDFSLFSQEGTAPESGLFAIEAGKAAGMRDPAANKTA
jgi:hypothetical protein